MTLTFKGPLTIPKLDFFFFFFRNFLSAKSLIGIERWTLDHRVKATLLPPGMVLCFDFGPPTYLVVAAGLTLKIVWGWFSLAGLLQILFYYLWLPSNK